MPTDPPETAVTAGVLRGRRAGDVVRFAGVPYAAPPTGELRFAAPRPVDPWVGTRLALVPGVAPPQMTGGDQPVPDIAVGETGEDCLTAEVWTPAVEGRRPVLVWIPGGRYQVGGAGLATYDGARLAAEHDVVVVGLNYRLGVLGFLFADGVPSNLGLRDLRAALAWLRVEAPAFGGDPERIVVMGESAGAGAITHLLATPGADELVAGAIVQSGAPGATLDTTTAERVASVVLDAAGVGSVEELRTLPLDALLAAQTDADAALLATVGMMPLHPVVDGELLPVAPLDAARAGKLTRVPLVVGTTDHEMELFRSTVPQLPHDIATRFLTAKLTPVLGRPPSPHAVEAGLAAVDGDLVEAIADTDLHVPAALLADAQTTRGVPVWRYRFGWEAPRVRAAHATDLPFTFGTLNVGDWRRFLGADGPGARAEADELSSRMRAAWAAFCHRLEPACDPIGTWPPHDPVRRPVIRLGPAIDVIDDPDGARFRAWTAESGVA